MDNIKSRNAGLDAIRSIAIVFVMMQHSSLLLSDQFNILPYMKLPDGVDVFFVLSGFLIGGMIIRKINVEEKWTWKSVADFIQRRWFRTLPNYFLFLIINIVLVYVGITAGLLNKNTFAYFFFLQNLYKPLDLFFWESWSLSVEEWFYFLFPLFLLLIYFLNKNKKQLLFIAILAFILVPLFIRILTADIHDAAWTTWDLYYRKLVITRLDCIAYGVLGAFVSTYYQSWWKKTRVTTFIIGIISVFFLCGVKFSEITFINKTFYFSLNSLAIILVFPLTESYAEEKIPLRPLKFISDISYSVYLSHLPLMYAILKLWQTNTVAQTLVRYIVYLIVVTLISHLLFRYFEEPVKHLRESVSKKLVQKT